jgi:O-antigen/teichoic acid export membrane protein
MPSQREAWAAGEDVLHARRRQPGSTDEEWCTATPRVQSAVATLTSRGGLYLGLRYGLGILVSFVNMFVLTWWIGPHAYGLFVTALGLSGFLANLTRAGADTYLIRRQTEPDRRIYAVAATLIGGISIVLMAVGIAAAPLLIRWYGSREFVHAYLATLFTVPLAGLAGPPTAKLERELNFRAVAGIELGGQVMASAVSILLAWRGLGVWAPVCGLLVWQTWAAVGAFAAARLVPRIAFDREETRAMLSFGVGYTGSLRVWQLRSLVNPLLVGRFAGAEGVAFVALAIRIAEGLGFVRVVAGRLAIAGLSRLQHDRNSFQAALGRALELQVLTLGPLLCAFAMAGPFLVSHMLGVRWGPSLVVYPFVAAGVLVNSVFNLQASALFVAGQQWTVLRSYLCNLALLGAGTVVLLPHLGIAGYGWADLAACGGYGLMHARVARIARISYRRLGARALAFLLPLFTRCVQPRWSGLLWLPLAAMAADEIWRRTGSIRSKRITDTSSILSSRAISRDSA